MQKKRDSTLHPDLIIAKSTAIDRMGVIASQAAEKKEPNFIRQIQLVRSLAHNLCSKYINCRVEDWCFLCNSGQTGPLRKGSDCLSCKLLSNDVRIKMRDDLEDIT